MSEALILSVDSSKKRRFREPFVPDSVCQDYEPYATLPTRVIEVPTDINANPRLIIGNGQVGVYVTLSHCWGLKRILTTTTKTLEQFQKEIPFQELPKSFRDAITITRKLGFKYIWIDSLCIVQDSREDWRTQSAQMAEIYANCGLMISADLAADSSVGMLNLRQPLISPPFGAGGHFRLRRPVPSSSINLEPLHTRGWTLQERLLARHTLHFALDQISFESYGSAVFEESTPDDFPSKGHDLGSSSMNFFRYAIIGTEKVSSYYGYDENDYLSAWYGSIEEFSGRKLTKASDKLPATAGLASAFGKLPGMPKTYLAGLWRHDILQGLLWAGHEMSKGDIERRFYCPYGLTARYIGSQFYKSSSKLEISSTYRAPSWSWAALDGPVVFPCPASSCSICLFLPLPRNGKQGDGDLHYNNAQTRDQSKAGSKPNVSSKNPNRDKHISYKRFDAQLGDYDMNLESSNPYAEVLKGTYIELTGFYDEIVFNRRKRNIPHLKSIAREGKPIPIETYFDIEQPSLVRKDCLFLQIARTSRVFIIEPPAERHLDEMHFESMVYGLLLIPSTKEGGSYCRLGVGIVNGEASVEVE